LKPRAIFGRRLAAVKDNLKNKNPARFTERGLNFLFERTYVRCHGTRFAADDREALPHRIGDAFKPIQLPKIQRRLA
jgi:hypothetical protein